MLSLGKNLRVVRESDEVVLCVNGDLFIFAVAKPQKTIHLTKRQVSLSPLIGALYGSLFELVGSDLVPINKRPEITDVSVKEAGVRKEEETNDNRNLVDNSSAQKLTPADILNMKKQGVGGAKIVEALAANSSTFHSKTKFSQLKYLKKKQKKHCRVVQVLSPTLPNIWKAHFERNARKICHLRLDTIGQMLSFANVCATSRVAVVEQCHGILTAAVMERIGGFGSVTQLSLGNGPVIGAIKQFNFEKKIMDSVQYCPLGDYIDRATHEVDGVETPFTSLLIAVAENPCPIFETVLPLLQPSRPFVLFCQYIEPLARCQQYLVSQSLGACLILRELWTREYQVLPLRTHPQMRTHGASGFVLSGVKVDSSSSAAPRAKKRRVDA